MNHSPYASPEYIEDVTGYKTRPKQMKYLVEVLGVPAFLNGAGKIRVHKEALEVAHGKPLSSAANEEDTTESRLHLEALEDGS